MNERDQVTQSQLGNSEAEIHRHSGTSGVSAVKEYIGLRKAELQGSFLHKDNMVDVAETQGRVRELDALLRIIESGPYRT